MMHRDGAALHRAVTGALESGRPERAFDACVEAARTHRAPSVRRYAARLLGTVAPKVPVSARTHARRGLARGLVDPWAVPLPRPGVVAFPTVRGECGGCADDCFVHVHIQPWKSPNDGLPDDLCPASLAAIVDALAAARTLEGRDTTFRVRFEGPAGWSGDSAGLAVALAAVSALRGQAVPDRVVATGRVAPDGAVHAVGHLTAKATLLRAARPRARMLVATGNADGDPGRVPVADLAAACVAAWGDDAGLDLDTALPQVREQFRQGQWVQAAVLADTLLADPELEDEERAELLGMRLAAANHSGDATQGAELAARLDAVLTRGVPAAKAVQAMGHLAIRALDDLNIDAAETLAEEAGGLLAPDAAAQVHALGPLALVRRLQGRFEESVALRRRSLALAERTERPRCLGDLSAALLHAGQAEAALEQAEAALAAVDRMRRRRGYRDLTRPFIRYHQARALRANGRIEVAREIFAEVSAVPGLTPSLFAFLALCELDGEAGLARLEERHGSMPGFLQELPILRALFDRSRARLGDEAAGRRLCAMLGLPAEAVEEAGRRLPY